MNDIKLLNDVIIFFIMPVVVGTIGMVIWVLLIFRYYKKRGL